MKEGPDISTTAALIGDPARANMLTALMQGGALTARELAEEAGITAQTASSHIARLEEGGLVAHRKEGRHKYVSLAGPEVAAVLEALMGFAAGQGRLRTRPGPRDPALRHARRCYNHLAGDRGVQLYDALRRTGTVTGPPEAPTLTDTGRAEMLRFGIDLPQLEAARAPLCRACLDWSARRPHLGGSLGRALLARMEALDWLHRQESSRALRITAQGAAAFDHRFPPRP